jgi:hypothetical protein
MYCHKLHFRTSLHGGRGKGATPRLSIIPQKLTDTQPVRKLFAFK